MKICPFHQSFRIIIYIPKRKALVPPCASNFTLFNFLMSQSPITYLLNCCPAFPSVKPFGKLKSSEFNVNTILQTFCFKVQYALLYFLMYKSLTPHLLTCYPTLPSNLDYLENLNFLSLMKVPFSRRILLLTSLCPTLLSNVPVIHPISTELLPNFIFKVGLYHTLDILLQNAVCSTLFSNHEIF